MAKTPCWCSLEVCCRRSLVDVVVRVVPCFPPLLVSVRSGGYPQPRPVTGLSALPITATMTTTAWRRFPSAVWTSNACACHTTSALVAVGLHALDDDCMQIDNDKSCCCGLSDCGLLACCCCCWPPTLAPLFSLLETPRSAPFWRCLPVCLLDLPTQVGR